MTLICHVTQEEIWRSTHHIDTLFQREWHLFQEGEETRLSTNKKEEVPISSCPSKPLQKLYQCDVCGYTTSKRNLNQHKAEVHKAGNKTFICESCPFTCASKGGLTNHQLWRHRDDKKYECDLCPYTSSIKKELQRHLKVLHKKTCVMETMRKFQKAH